VIGDSDSLLVVVALIAAGSDCDSLGSPLWPLLLPLVLLFAPLPATLSGAPRLSLGPAFLSPWTKNSPDRLLARGVPAGDVEQLLRGLWLITVELMHQGSTARVGPEC
jgi:hypothetical protein